MVNDSILSNKKRTAGTMIGSSNLSDTAHIQLAAAASVVVACILIGLKFFAWDLTNSVSLQGSLIDSLLDAIASLINMVAVYHAMKPADREHRFGHGKIESFGALTQALFIGISSLWVLREAAQRFFIPEPVEQSEVGLIVMAVAMVMTVILIAYQRRVVNQTGSHAIAADKVHYESDLLINCAVVVSLLTTHLFHTDIMDSILGLLIGLYILWAAWKIALKAFNVLMDRELDDQDRQKILLILNSHPDVLEVKDLRTRSSGLQQFFQLRLVVSAELSLQRANSVAEEVEQEVVKAYPKCQVMIRLVPYA